jgi:hypothetical protein
MKQETVAILSVGVTLLVAILILGNMTFQGQKTLREEIRLVREDIAEFRRDVAGLRDRVSFMQGALQKHE